MRHALIAIGVLFASSAAAGPRQDLDLAVRYFKNKDCQEAVPILKDLLYPKPQLTRNSEICEARVVLGACHYELEPLIYTEGQVKLFDETRKDVEARAERDRKLRELEEERDRLRRLAENTQAFETRSFGLNFAPLGAGQFQNGHRTKGLIVAGGQAATAITSLGIFLYLAGTYGLEAKVPLEDANSVRRLQQIEVATGAAFFAIYAYSIVDGIIYYKPRVRTEVDPALLEELKKKRPKTSSRVRFGPMLLPGGAGVGIAWEND
jgi:hypothetical protein